MIGYYLVHTNIEVWLIKGKLETQSKWDNTTSIVFQCNFFIVIFIHCNFFVFIHILCRKLPPLTDFSRNYCTLTDYASQCLFSCLWYITIFLPLDDFSLQDVQILPWCTSCFCQYGDKGELFWEDSSQTTFFII